MTSIGALRNSALWAAWGDALGFITELTGESGVIRRVGTPVVTETVGWRRLVGGRFGVTLDLPAGAYSDDTQLRLASSRSLRGDGSFAVEAFAKVELPAWLTYALGGGLGVRAAANALLRRSVTWSGNVYSTKKARYVAAGGNGAAMRIQPHVWAASNPGDWESFTTDVVRNSIVTHGHPRAIVGAVLHACLLGAALSSRDVPGPNTLMRAVDWIRHVPQLIRSDEDLAHLWLPRWEEGIGRSLEDAFSETRDECEADLRVLLEAHSSLTREERWVAALAGSIDATSEAARGSGTKTALLASVAVLMHSDSPTEVVRSCANALGADTDTIATMAGALAGAVDPTKPSSPIQDIGYISNEAVRLKAIADRKAASTHPYPDLLDWAPASSPLDLVGIVEGELILAGLGALHPIESASVEVRGEVWQWAELPFSQRVLVRRRLEPRPLSSKVVPGWGRQMETASARESGTGREPTLFDQQSERPRAKRKSGGTSRTKLDSVEARAQSVIRANFTPEIIGKHLLEVAEDDDERGTAAQEYAALVARAFAESKSRESRKGKSGRRPPSREV